MKDIPRVIKGGIPRYPAAVCALILFGVGLRWEAVQSGFFADDYAQIGMLEGRYPLRRSPADLFSFSDGTKAEGELLIRSGFYPWFSDPLLRLSMFRPLASGMIWLDHRVFGLQPLGYHIHSILWWCALLGAVAALYRKLLPPAHALVALGLFTVDEAHGVIITWIANRCAIVCVFLALLGLIHYVRRRESNGQLSAWPEAVYYTLSFGFGEYALCTLGYVLAHEWLRGRGSASERVRSLSPVLVPALIFLGLRGMLHRTPLHSGVYVDPLAEPLAFASALASRVPVLAADMILALRGEYWTFGFDPWIYRWLDPTWIARDWFERLENWRTAHVALGMAACVLFVFLTRWLWTRGANPHLRWLAVGSALSVLPVAGSFPSARLMLVPLIGFTPLVAGFLLYGLARARALIGSDRTMRGLVIGALALSLCAYQLFTSCWLTRNEMIGMDVGSRRMRNAVLRLEADEKQLPHQHIIMLAAPEGSTSMYVPLTRWVYGKAVPLSCFTLSLSPTSYALTRVADNAFTIDFRPPARMLRTAPEQLLRSSKRPLEINEVIDTGVFRVMILALQDRLPSRLLVRFEVALEDPGLRFMTATREGIRHFTMPPIGSAVEVPLPVVPD